jgi:hypothetical protein
MRFYARPPLCPPTNQGRVVRVRADLAAPGPARELELEGEGKRCATHLLPPRFCNRRYKA